VALAPAEDSVVPLNRAEAVAFAGNVMEAVDIVKDEHVNEVHAGDLVAWAVRALYGHARQKVPPHVAKRLKATGALDNRQLRELLADARLALGRRRGLEDHNDLTATVRGMLDRFDPDSRYDPDSPGQKCGCQFDKLPGIGVHLDRDTRTGGLRIVTPLKGGPAHKARLYAGDAIIAVTRDVDVNGERLPRPMTYSTRRVPFDTATGLLVAETGTRLTLTVRRPGLPRLFHVPVRCGPAQDESVLGWHRKHDDSWDHLIDRENRIGYVRLTHFARCTCLDLEAVLKDLVKQRMHGLVLDLRANPGGLLDIAVKVADLYLDDGLIVSIQPRGGPKQAMHFRGRRSGSLLGFPMVCLVDGGSASASEIVAAALQDHHRALVLGERSRGRCRVQTIRDFEVVGPRTREVKKAEIALTTAVFCRPSGASLNRTWVRGREDDAWGVTPDRVIELTPDERRGLAEHLRRLETIERPERRGQSTFWDRHLAAALGYLRGRARGSGNAAR
jgi:C-terminal peptidase prc